MLVSYLYLLGLFIGIGLIVNKRLSFIIPVTFILLSLSIMLGGIIGDLRIGVFILPVIVVVLLVYKTIVQCHNRLTVKRVINHIFELIKSNLIELCLFTIFFIYFCLYHSNSTFSNGDECTHWGPMVKGMFETNNFYCYLDINNIHPDYPPFFQCIQYLFCYLSGNYTEPILYKALSISTISLMFPILSLANQKFKTKTNLLYIILFGFIFVTLCSIHFVDLYSIYHAIYIDMPIAVISAVVAFVVLDSKDEPYYLICLYLLAIVLSKEIGLAFYLILMLLILFKKTVSNLNKKDIIKTVVFYIVIPCMFIVIWKMYISGLPKGQFSLTRISIPELVDIVFHNKGTVAQSFIRNNFFKRMLSLKLINIMFIDITLIPVILFISAIWFIIIVKKDFNNKLLLIVNLLLGFLGYIITLFILYLYCFSDHEMLTFASFNRYVSTYVCYLIALTTFMILSVIYRTNKHRIIYSVLVVVILFCLSNTRIYYSLVNFHTYYTKLNWNTNDLRNTSEFIDFSNKIKRNVKKGKVLIILDSDKYYYNFYANNYFYKDVSFDFCRLDDYIFNLREYSNRFDEKKCLVNGPQQNFIDEYKDKYDYLYVWSTSDSLKKAWQTTQHDKLISKGLYRNVLNKLVLIE